MQGAPRPSNARPVADRIIPPDAGSTASPKAGCTATGDHPRRYGEHRNPSMPVWIVYGSSPQMRGALGIIAVEMYIKRIIPADTGSTATQGNWYVNPEDHPRRCGEHRTVSWHYPVFQGSSPQMRGARAPRPSPATCSGIIPADAGSTPAW